MSSADVLPSPSRRAGTLAAAGAGAWVAWLAVVRPEPFATDWIRALLLFAPLVLFPLAADLLPPGPGAGSTPRARLAPAAALAAALLLAVSAALPQGLAAAVLALPWLGVAVAVALGGAGRIVRRGPQPLADLVVDAGAVYLAVGGAWTVADRLGFRPLGFATAIVALTAVHFHHAGFVLPLVTGFAMRRRPGRLAAAAGVAAIAAVPLVATGITATRLGLGVVVEASAAVLMAAGGGLAAALHLRLAADAAAPAAARLLWAAGGAALLAGMALAALYGLRFVLPWRLDLGWMQVSHGPLNAVGFGLATLLGWRRAPG